MSMIGHNNPPTEIEIVALRLSDYKNEALILSRLAEREIPAEILDDTMAGEISDHIEAARTLSSRIGDIHKKEKAPFWEAGKVCDKWKNDYEAKINVVIAKAEPAMLEWVRKKKKAERDRQLAIEKKAREEAEKLLVEAAVHEAEGIHDTAAELVQAAVQEETKADMIAQSTMHVKARAAGTFSTSGIKMPWVSKVESMAALDLEILRKYMTEEEAEKLLARAVRDGVRDVRGARIYQEEKLSVRGR